MRSKYILPASWESPLIDNDLSELNEYEQNAFNEWINKFDPGACLEVLNESEFKMYHDARAFVIPCKCSTFVFENKG